MLIQYDALLTLQTTGAGLSFFFLFDDFVEHNRARAATVMIC
jgi:hypothetical protein